MNQENDKRSDTDVDPAVSDQVKALFDETTPETLDRAVMREARRAIRADNRRGSFDAWFRPLAFVATVVLSLTIILDLVDPSIFGSSPESGIEAITPATTPPAADQTLEATARSRGQATLNELKRQEKTPAGEAPAQVTRSAIGVADDSNKAERGRMSKLRPARPADMPQTSEPPLSAPEEHVPGGDALYMESQQAGQRVQDAGAGSEAAALTRSAAEAQLPAARPGAEARVQATPMACSKEQKAAPDEWWECIEALRAAGQTEVARLQADELKNTFPDFVPPQ